VLNNGQVERTDDPGKNADQDVDGWKSRLIVQADGVTSGGPATSNSRSLSDVYAVSSP